MATTTTTATINGGGSYQNHDNSILRDKAYSISSSDDLNDDDEKFYDAPDTIVEHLFHSTANSVNQLINEFQAFSTSSSSSTNISVNNSSSSSNRLNGYHHDNNDEQVDFDEEGDSVYNEDYIDDDGDDDDNHINGFKMNTSIKITPPSEPSSPTTTTNIASSENDTNGNSTASNNEDDCDDAELETSWTFFFDKCKRGTSFNDYEAGLKQIYTVNTVQSFWRVFNNIPDVSKLPVRCSYHLMRGTRKPLWEDPGNKKGGQWNLKCNKEDTSIVWREALLAAIGEQFSDCVAPGDEVVGVSASCRDKDDIIQIWNLDAKLSHNASVCKKLEELVPNVNFTVKFYKPNESHEAFTTDNNNKVKSNGNAKYSNKK